MSAIITVHSLSSLSQVEFTPTGNNEVFAHNTEAFGGGIVIKKYNAFANAEDAVISNRTLLTLSDVKSVNEIYDQKGGSSAQQVKIQRFLLKTARGRTLNVFQNEVFVGGKGVPLYLIPMHYENDQYFLRPAADSYLEVSSSYPYEVGVSTTPITSDQIHRRLFEIEFSNRTMTIRTKTAEGYRYIAPNIDRRVRATGLAFGLNVLNDYYFLPAFDTSDEFRFDADYDLTETKYFNGLDSTASAMAVNVRTSSKKPTNNLLSVPIDVAISDGTAETNMSSLKNNFSPSGVYNVD